MFNRGTLRSSSLELVVSLRLRGRWYFFGTRPLEVANTTQSSDAGFPSTIVVGTGLAELVFQDRTEFASQSIQDGSVAVSVRFVGDNASGFQALAADDQDLGDSTAELALVSVGANGTPSDWTRRTVLAKGFLDAPEWGAPNDPVSFTISTDPTQDRARFPPDTARVDETTWPRSSSSGMITDERIYGEPYPWIFGSPGFLHGDEGYTVFPGSPAYIVELSDADRDNSNTAAVLLLAGHDTMAARQSSNVVIFNQTTGNSANVSASTTLDERGRKVTIASVSVGTLAIAEGDEMWAAWRAVDDDGGSGVYTLSSVRYGGVPDREGIQSMRTPGEIMRYLLGFSSIRWNSGALEEVERQAAGYKLDFFINRQRAPVDFILDDILPLLPMGTRVGPLGLEFVLWDVNAEASDAVMVIDVDRGDAERVSTLRRSSSQAVVNDQRIDFALRPDVGAFLRYLRASPLADEDDAFTFQDTRATASATRYAGPDGGGRQGAQISTDVVLEPATARAVLGWKIGTYAGTRIEVSYQLRQEGQALKPGDVVLISDAEVGLSSRVAHVTGVTRAPGDTVVDLLLLQDWIRDALAGA